MQNTIQKIHICKECSFEIEINGHSQTCSLRLMPDTINKKLAEFDEYYPELLTEAGEVRKNVKAFIANALNEIREETIRDCIKALPYVAGNKQSLNDDELQWNNAIDESKQNLKNLLTK